MGKVNENVSRHVRVCVWQMPRQIQKKTKETKLKEKKKPREANSSIFLSIFFELWMHEMVETSGESRP